MVTITASGASVTIENGPVKATYPKGTLSVHADADSDSVDFRMRASRKTIISVRYDETNMAGADAQATAEAIAAIL